MIVASYATSHGATVQIADNYMVSKGSAEELRIIKEQRRTAHDILVAWCEREGQHGKRNSA